MAGSGMFAWFSYPLPTEQCLQIIKQAGFDATSLWWGDKEKNLEPEMARRFGLDIDNIHAPFKGANDFWEDKLDGAAYYHFLLDCIDDCHLHSIPTVVIHITKFSPIPPVTEIGLDRMKRLVDAAEKKQVNLALENLNDLTHLDSIFSNIKSSRLGFCYDSGHENCFHPDADCLSRYGDKLFAIHLDDNCGDADSHLLPFDGSVKWDRVRENLKKCKALRYLTLEVDFNPKHEKSQLYKKLPAEDFASLAYQRLQFIKGR